MANNLKFRVSSGIKDIVGKDLITDDFIAVFELVKNSYDARAKHVVLTFEERKIVIADNGKGMSLDDIKNKWLYLAYSAKKDNTEDLDEEEKVETYRDRIGVERHYAGSKGIGRFSADRLGKKLILTTKEINSKKIEQIKIDWGKFNDQNREFGTIEIEHKTLYEYKIPFPDEANHGVILEIEGASYWKRDKLVKLKHSLEKLINPFSEMNDFGVSMVCNRELGEDESGHYKKGVNKAKKYLERDKVNGPVKNAILDILELKTTQISVEITLDSIETRILDRGTLIYHIEEENKDYSLLENVRIDLYFLNIAAKNNFTRKMGVQPVNFGSVFLFKNGFRIQPFGEKGDDSWGLDYRSQQGYKRFLGTRDLFGRVDITTRNAQEFKEVSSRDGGLVETNGYYELLSAFKEKALVRLERYVVGVLWGEGFRKRKYFGEGIEGVQKAEFYRKNLQDKDKNSDNISFATSNLGSKIDFIQIIKSLSQNKDVKILKFNHEFIDLVNERLDEVQSKFINDLETIAERTNDPEVRVKIGEAEKKYQELKKEKEAAEKRAEEAEKKAKKEEEARILAEKRRREEEEKRRKAELESLRKEKLRAEAELAKLKAEKKAKEEEERRAKEAEARKRAEEEVAIKNEQITRYKASTSIEYKDLRDSNHIIGVYSDDIAKKILLLKRKLDKGKNISQNEFLNFIQGISLANEKIATITRFTTKSNFLKASLETDEDIVSFVIDYLHNIYQVLYDMDIEIIGDSIKFIKKFQPIELITAIDNILSNSRKKNAARVIFEFRLLDKQLQLLIRDIGDRLSDKIQNWNLIFDEGVTTTKGSGLGLNHVKRIIEGNLKGSIIYNPEYNDGFELIITIPK